MYDEDNRLKKSLEFDWMDFHLFKFDLITLSAFAYQCNLVDLLIVFFPRNSKVVVNMSRFTVIPDFEFVVPEHQITVQKLRSISFSALPFRITFFICEWEQKWFNGRRVLPIVDSLRKYTENMSIEFTFEQQNIRRLSINNIVNKTPRKIIVSENPFRCRNIPTDLYLKYFKKIILLSLSSLKYRRHCHRCIEVILFVFFYSSVD